MKNKEVEEHHRYIQRKVNNSIRKERPDYQFEDDRIVAIGYLDSSEEFEKGEVPEGFLLKLDYLWHHGNGGLILSSLGFHECDFCEGGYGTGERATSSSEKMLTDKINKVMYIFPEMIFHYIKKHQFKPSDKFIEFVMRS